MPFSWGYPGGAYAAPPGRRDACSLLLDRLGAEQVLQRGHHGRQAGIPADDTADGAVGETSLSRLTPVLRFQPALQRLERLALVGGGGLTELLPVDALDPPELGHQVVLELLPGQVPG